MGRREHACASARALCMQACTTYVYDDVTYVYDDVTCVYDDVTCALYAGMCPHMLTVWLYARMHARTCTRARACAREHARTCTRMHTHTHGRARMHTHTGGPAA